MAQESINKIQLLRSGIQGFAAGFNSDQNPIPEFGQLVLAEIENTDIKVFGIVHNINVEDDGMVRQIVTSGIDDSRLTLDGRRNRNVPMEIGVISIGYQKSETFKHNLPPLVPLSMTKIDLCDDKDIVNFTSAGNFGYFRHILRNKDLPIGEILAAHISQAHHAHQSTGNTEWARNAARELISQLRDDYPTLMEVLGALSDAIPAIDEGAQNG